MYAALRQAAFVETVSYWRTLLALYDAQGGVRSDLATTLGVTPEQLDGVPSAYWFDALCGLLYTRMIVARQAATPAASLDAGGWDLNWIADNMPLTTQAVASLLTTG